MNSLLRSLLKPINPTASVLLGCLTFVWGVWLLAWWDVFGSAKLYRVLGGLAPEWAWGGIAILVGLLMAHGAISRSYGPLIVGSMAACMFWLCVSLCLFLADWHNTGGLVYLFISIYGAFIYLNVKLNHDAGYRWGDSE